MKAEIEALIQKHANSSTFTRVAAQNIASQFNSQEAFDVIRDYVQLSSISRLEWLIGINVLCHLDENQANQVFNEMLFIDDLDRQYRLIKLLAGWGNSVVVPNLIKLLESHEDPDIRYITAYTLGQIGDKRALKALEWTAENDHDTNYEDSTVSSIANAALKHLLKTD